MHMHLPLATCDAFPATYNVFPAMPTGQAHMLPFQARWATSPADKVAWLLMHHTSVQAYPWVIGESEYNLSRVS